ncbi:MAG: cytochrome d ubiquinol oxidase subunit II [Fidelibacterota bacterium]
MTVELNILAFLLVGVLFTGYAVLDGFDLGVGAVHLLTKSDRERRIFLNAIGPVWDGNEVWLVTGGGALFAAFPEVYATVFSGFYGAFILLLFSLIFRAVAIEFRGKRPERWWKQVWDVSFSVSSIASGFLVGVALGNIAWGIPLDARHEFTGTFLSLLHPYPILVGVTTVALFIMHGCIFVRMKTEGALHDRVREWIRNAIIFFVLCYVTTTMVTLLYVPQMTVNIRENPLWFSVPFLTMLAVANVPREIHRGNDFKAFLSSSAAVVALLLLFGIGMYPYIVYSHPFEENSLTLTNAASSPATLRNVLLIAAIGFPLVLAYTVSVYWIFRGKVKLDSTSY